jgi:hypothetical protein
VPFLETVENAPVRSSVLAKSLAEVLRDVPADRRNALHDRYLTRVKYIQEKVVPGVITDLSQRIRSGDAMAAQARIIMTYLAGVS